MFKVFAFLKRNTALLSHDEYRAAHVGYHCGQSRRLKDIRGYMVNIWSNTPIRERLGDLYDGISFKEPDGFLNQWDGFPEVFFDNQQSWASSKELEPTRAMEEGLVIDPDWTLDECPCIFDPVSPDDFRSCHLQMHEHVIKDVEREEKRIFKLMQFYKKREGLSDKDFQHRVLTDYAPLLGSAESIQGLTVNFRDQDQASAMRGFIPDDAWGLSDDGVAHRAAFCEMWDGASALYFHNVDDFIAARQARHEKMKVLEQSLFSSTWYVEVDENMIVMPNRSPAPDFYYR